MPCMAVERYSVVMYMPKSRIDCLVVQQYYCCGLVKVSTLSYM